MKFFIPIKIARSWSAILIGIIFFISFPVFAIEAVPNTGPYYPIVPYSSPPVPANIPIPPQSPVLGPTPWTRVFALGRKFFTRGIPWLLGEFAVDLAKRAVARSLCFAGLEAVCGATDQGVSSTSSGSYLYQCANPSAGLAAVRVPGCGANSGSCIISGYNNACTAQVAVYSATHAFGVYGGYPLNSTCVYTDQSGAVFSSQSCSRTPVSSSDPCPSGYQQDGVECYPIIPAQPVLIPYPGGGVATSTPSCCPVPINISGQIGGSFSEQNPDGSVSNFNFDPLPDGGVEITRRTDTPGGTIVDRVRTDPGGTVVDSSSELSPTRDPGAGSGGGTPIQFPTDYNKEATQQLVRARLDSIGGDIVNIKDNVSSVKDDVHDIAEEVRHPNQDGIDGPDDEEVQIHDLTELITSAFDSVTVGSCPTVAYPGVDTTRFNTEICSIAQDYIRPALMLAALAMVLLAI